EAPLPFDELVHFQPHQLRQCRGRNEPGMVRSSVFGGSTTGEGARPRSRLPWQLNEAASAKLPHSQHASLATGKQGVAIGPEGHMLNLLLMPGQGEGVFFTFNFPQIDVTVATPGGESVSVRAECHRIYLDGRSEVPCVEGVLVSGVNCYEFPCVDVPQSCVFVIASNGQERFVRAEGTRSNLCTFVIDGGD